MLITAVAVIGDRSHLRSADRADEATSGPKSCESGNHNPSIDRMSSPTCIGGYAEADQVLTRIDPAAIAPSSGSIPVRIVVDTDGNVKQVHVIRANTAQRDGIETALGPWKLRPPRMNGAATEIETACSSILRQQVP